MLLLFMISLMIVNAESKFLYKHSIQIDQKMSSPKLIALSDKPVYNTVIRQYINIVVYRPSSSRTTPTTLLFLNTQNPSISHQIPLNSLPASSATQAVKHLSWTEAGIFLYTESVSLLLNPQTLQQVLSWRPRRQLFANMKIRYRGRDGKVLAVGQEVGGGTVDLYEGRDLVMAVRKEKEMGSLFVGVEFDYEGERLFCFDRNLERMRVYQLSPPNQQPIYQQYFSGRLADVLIATQRINKTNSITYPIVYMQDLRTFHIWSKKGRGYGYHSVNIEQRAYLPQVNSPQNSKYLLYKSYNKLYIRTISYPNQGNPSALPLLQSIQFPPAPKNPTLPNSRPQLINFDSNQDTIVCLIQESFGYWVRVYGLEEGGNGDGGGGGGGGSVVERVVFGVGSGVFCGILVCVGVVGCMYVKRIKKRKIQAVLTEMAQNPYQNHINQTSSSQPAINNQQKPVSPPISNQQQKQHFVFIPSENIKSISPQIAREVEQTIQTGTKIQQNIQQPDQIKVSAMNCRYKGKEDEQQQLQLQGQQGQNAQEQKMEQKKQQKQEWKEHPKLEQFCNKKQQLQSKSQSQQQQSIRQQFID